MTIRTLIAAGACATTLLTAAAFAASTAESPAKPAQPACTPAHGGMHAQAAGRQGVAGHENRMGQGMAHGPMHAGADHAAMHAMMHGEGDEHRHGDTAPAAPQAAPGTR